MARFFGSTVLLGLLLAVPAAHARRAPCDPAAAGEARSTVIAACPCEGTSRQAYVRCTRKAVATAIKNGLPSSCRRTLARLFHDSTCGFKKPKATCCERARNGASKCVIKSASRCAAATSRLAPPCNFSRFCADADCAGGGLGRSEVLYGGEGNRLRRYDIDTIKQPPLVDDILIPSASDTPPGRDINAQICFFPDGSGRFIAGEDSGQPHPPAGWGVFEADGTQIGKLTPTYQPAGDQPENFGCAFDHAGRLFLTDLGNQAAGGGTGQLILFFPPFDSFPGPPGAYPNTDAPSTNFCILATDIATAGSLAVDEQGRIYAASARGQGVIRFSPPFPTSPDAAGGCGAKDPVGSPMADVVHRETFVSERRISTATGIARARNGNWYVGSVLTGTIAEYTPDGTFVRTVLEPPAGEFPPVLSTGNPQGLEVDCTGDVYFADLNLIADGSPGIGIGPGPNGKVRWIHFDADGTPQPPVIVKQNLDFPDALGLAPGNLP